MAETKTSLFSVEKSTLIPIGTILAVVITATVWLQGTLLDLTYKIDALKLQVQTMQSGMTDRWTQSEMKNWVDLLIARNPTLQIPPVPNN